MANGLSTYARDEIMDHMNAKGSWTAPTNIYLALGNTAWSAGAAGTELSGSGYARVLITSAIGASSGGAATNGSDIVYAALSGTLTAEHWAIYDQVSGGNYIWFGSFAAPKTANSGDQFRIATGELDLAINNS